MPKMQLSDDKNIGGITHYAICRAAEMARPEFWGYWDQHKSKNNNYSLCCGFCDEEETDQKAWGDKLNWEHFASPLHLENMQKKMGDEKYIEALFTTHYHRMSSEAKAEPHRELWRNCVAKVRSREISWRDAEFAMCDYLSKIGRLVPMRHQRASYWELPYSDAQIKGPA